MHIFDKINSAQSCIDGRCKAAFGFCQISWHIDCQTLGKITDAANSKAYILHPAMRIGLNMRTRGSQRVALKPSRLEESDG